MTVRPPSRLFAALAFAAVAAMAAVAPPRGACDFLGPLGLSFVTVAVVGMLLMWDAAARPRRAGGNKQRGEGEAAATAEGAERASQGRPETTRGPPATSSAAAEASQLDDGLTDAEADQLRAAVSADRAALLPLGTSPSEGRVAAVVDGTLVLSDHRAERVPPWLFEPALFDTSALRSLDLSRNRLKELPAAIGTLRSLAELR